MKNKLNNGNNNNKTKCFTYIKFNLKNNIHQFQNLFHINEAFYDFLDLNITIYTSVLIRYTLYIITNTYTKKFEGNLIYTICKWKMKLNIMRATYTTRLTIACRETQSSSVIFSFNVHRKRLFQFFVRIYG